MDYIERTLEKTIKDKLFKGKAIIIYGARQCGKTTLIKHIIQTENLDPVIINGDETKSKNLFSEVSRSKWKQILGNKNCVFIDEGQNIPNLGSATKLLVDNKPEVQVIITGSSSFQLASRMEEPLTGRKYEYQLFPLTYKELVKKLGYVNEINDLETRLVFGSYPEIVTSENKKELLKLLSTSYLYKDLLQYEGIRKPKLLEKILKALAFQCGNQVSKNELSSTLGVSRTLVESYLSLLEQAYIIFPLASYSTNQRKELKKSNKYYFWDNGILNSIIEDYSPISERRNIGALWENYLISERKKTNYYVNSSIFSYFWRTTDKMEVDYIEKENTLLLAYEFKWNINKKSRITKAFTNKYPKSKVETITPNNYDKFLG